MDRKRLLEAIDSLPDVKRLQVEDLIRFLASKEDSTIPPLSFSWAGGLSDLRATYTSRDLKKQALDEMARYRG